MTKYRSELPQQTMSTFMTDGGLETDLIFNKGIDLPEFAAFDLLKNEEGRDILSNYYRDYLNVSKQKCSGFIGTIFIKDSIKFALNLIKLMKLKQPTNTLDRKSVV